jgi:hypothetical protein
MTEDVRCCGTGTCLINEEGYCWCGQRWDGEKMCSSVLTRFIEPEPQSSEALSMVIKDQFPSSQSPS